MMSEELKCNWSLRTPCFGNVESKTIFGGQLSVSMCAGHHEEHLKIMLISKLGALSGDFFHKTNDEQDSILNTALADAGLELNAELEKIKEIDGKRE